MQFKAKNKYYAKGNRWYKMLTYGTYEKLDWETYNYIFGDKIFTAPSTDAKIAFEQECSWLNLMFGK
jgi:hypothetical protein